MTNTQQLTGQWNELKGKIQQRWSKLTDQDLEKVGEKMDRLGDMIAARYQLGKEEARKQLDEFTKTWKSSGGKTSR